MRAIPRVQETVEPSYWYKPLHPGIPVSQTRSKLRRGKGVQLAKPTGTYPIEGIVTRLLLEGRHDSGYNIGFIECSNPGLRGQSGGPVVDVDGTIWGIQSQTKHLELGFAPPVKNTKGSPVEHQFLNVGWSVHAETLIGFLNDSGVAHATSET